MLALPLAFSLDALYPWVSPGMHDMPPDRRTFLTVPFFVARACFYLVAWAVLAVWMARTRRTRVAGAVGLAVLAPTVTFAAGDWILMREPQWWSSLFGFAFATSQLLAALAGAILISLLRPERPSARRMQSLERALLTLSLLTIWIWFAQFLIVWLVDLPNEASWYLTRSGHWQWVLYAAIAPLVLAILLLAPPGFGRGTMIVGSALVLLHHAAHMTWLVIPAGRQGPPGWTDVIMAVAVGVVWGAWFCAGLHERPAFREEPSALAKDDRGFNSEGRQSAP
jgi:hypothetical protein